MVENPLAVRDANTMNINFRSSYSDIGSYVNNIAIPIINGAYLGIIPPDKAVYLLSIIKYNIDSYFDKTE